MKSWKYYVKIVLDNPIYLRAKDETLSKKERKKSKRFFKKYGFYHEETWNLDCSLDRFLISRLAYLRDKSDIHPSCLDEKEWKQILTDMIKGFVIDMKKCGFCMTEEDTEKTEKAKKLLITYWNHLWS